MDKSLLQNPLAIVVIALVLALIPLLFNSENFLIIFRLISFGMFFYAIHLFFKKKKLVKK